MVKVFDDFFYTERIACLQNQVNQLEKSLAEARKLLQQARHIQLTLVIDKTENEIKAPKKAKPKTNHKKT